MPIEPAMLALSDDELTVIMACARPLLPQDRDAFTKDVASQLATYPERGPGLVGRICAATQRKYFSPPSLHGSVGRWSR